MKMFNPPHPGVLIKSMYFEPLEITVTYFAKKLGVSRKHVSELLNEKSGISPEMAVRLSLAFGTSVEMWLDMWRDYSLSKVDESTLHVEPLFE